jgi:uncharacterized protein YuzE
MWAPPRLIGYRLGESHERHLPAGKPAVTITYDPADDTAYIYLVGDPLPPGRDRMVCDGPGELDDPDGRTVIMDWKDGKLVGIEVPAVSSLLHADLLAQALSPRASQAGADETET